VFCKDIAIKQRPVAAAAMMLHRSIDILNAQLQGVGVTIDAYTSDGEGLGNRGRTQGRVRGKLGPPLHECRGPGQSAGNFEIFNILRRNIELKNRPI